MLYKKCVGDIVHEGHRQRLKDKYLKNGLDNFEDHEILELLLFYAIPRRDTNEIAHLLLDTFGSLSGVFNASVEELKKVSGIADNSALLLNIVPSLSRMYLKDRWKKKIAVSSTDVAGEYCKSLFVGMEYESFYVINITAKNEVIAADEVHKGTINEVSIYPRLIVEDVLKNKGHSVILSHNHPGGSMKPSKADIAATVKIKSALDAIGVQVKDHISRRSARILCYY